MFLQWIVQQVGDAMAYTAKPRMISQAIGLIHSDKLFSYNCSFRAS